ncbi:hypothetical protein NDU88_001742 [Pleurodeles waltl]|uniref:Uncharacterized protein n=1 Tax=Pleurodeles waltl TaxID=8319 RepID=A0AAV7LDP1_PLEWA|nr:hypothetical protein NDU88_001742 [Pleurodeles waltl]
MQGSVLANVIRPKREKNMIIAVQAEVGSEITEPELIASRFCEYYEPLYTFKSVPDPEALLDYLLHIVLLWLKETDRVSYDPSDP